MDSEIENKTNRAPAVKVAGMRVPAPDHPVPIVRKEFEHKTEKDKEENNEEQRELERAEKFELDRLGRMAAGERLAKIQGNQPKNEPFTNFRQKENIPLTQPVLHNHSKSGAAALQ
ncbi:hypothetical protein BGX21_002184 [Mortierella sp. AD011]|nr:hypothetical protein BGX20_000048 [Mortierella sp. AD010]KAF9401273.1 hypothetical protein BGX21_002184 [Mortierella sp. AD011]